MVFNILVPLGRNGGRLDHLLIMKEGKDRLFRFVNATRRLHGTFGDLKMADKSGGAGKQRTGTNTGQRTEAGRDDDGRGTTAQRRLRQTTLRFEPI